MLSVSTLKPRHIVVLACRGFIEIAGSEARSFTQIMAGKQTPLQETGVPAKIRKLPYYSAHPIFVVVVSGDGGGGGVCVCVCVVYFLLPFVVVVLIWLLLLLFCC